MNDSGQDSSSLASLGFSIALAVTGLIVAIVAAVTMRIGSLTEPGPGYFPFYGGAALFALTILDIVVRWRKSALRGPDASEREVSQNWRAYALIGALAVYVLILGWAGFVISTFLLAVAVLWIAKRPTWLAAIGCGLIASLGSYFLFERLLGVSLSKGVLISFW
jgi:putative tricarboxylic transport membrane protein